MDKLFWIVCEDKNSTLYEGRFQGRTRTAAIRFLKATLVVKSLKGLVFTVTEIPVPLIREIVAELLGISMDELGRTELPRTTRTPPEGHGSQTTHSNPADPEVPPEQNPQVPTEVPARHTKNHCKVGNPGLGDDFWSEVHAYWRECRSIKQTAIKFKLSQNSVKTRARREGWRKNDPTD